MCVPPPRRRVRGRTRSARTHKLSQPWKKEGDSRARPPKGEQCVGEEGVVARGRRGVWFERECVYTGTHPPLPRYTHATSTDDYELASQTLLDSPRVEKLLKFPERGGCLKSERRERESGGASPRSVDVGPPAHASLRVVEAQHGRTKLMRARLVM